MKIVQPIRNKADIEKMKNELAKSGSRNRLLFTMGINTGLRISDILQLKVGDVAGNDYYVLTEQKTGKRKRISLHAVKEEISAYTQNREPEEWLFPSRRGDQPITRIQAYRILNDAAEVCGLEEIGTHTLRKTFGYHFYKATKDVAMLQTLFNHSAPSITLRYIGIAQDEIDEAMLNFSL